MGTEFLWQPQAQEHSQDLRLAQLSLAALQAELSQAVQQGNPEQVPP